MKLKPTTKIQEIYDKHPWIIDYLPTLAPHFKQLQDASHREKMFKVATIQIAAESGGFTVDELINLIQEEIKRRNKGEDEEKKEILKGIIRDLHAGVEMNILRDRFARLVEDVSATEIAEIEQSLIAEGLPESEVKRLCDVHVEVFKQALDDDERPRPPDGHPVHTFMVENRATENILQEIDNLICTLPEKPTKKDLEKHRETLLKHLEKLEEIEKHYLRKENQLFPKLEAYDVTGPTSVMWALHDDIRYALKTSKNQLEEGDPKAVTSLKELIITINDMIYKEEHILYPMSLETLNDRDWYEVKQGEEEIGYSWTEPLVEWKPDLEDIPEKPKGLTGKIRLDEGYLTPEQVNMMLKHLPVDVTYVDENDKVAYYSAGKHRIFPRSPGIIGREVKRCHPPKSVHIVENIVKAFKNKEKDEAEFWLNLDGRFLHIRYYPLFDEAGEYKGTIEVSQDVTGIRKLEGEQRLLDWTL